MAKSEKNFNLDSLDGSEAKAILKNLINQGGAVSKAVIEEIESCLNKVDIEEISLDVFAKLDNLCVEELWSRSGSTRYGYVDPYEETWTMIKEVLKPYVDRIGEYHTAGIMCLADDYCLAVLSGIVEYKVSSVSEFRDWAVDDPYEAFTWVLSKWRKGAGSDQSAERFEAMMRFMFPEWVC